MPHALPAGKLLFSHGRFERSAPRAMLLPSAAALDHDITQSLPSPSLPDHFCCRRRRASTGGYGEEDSHLQRQSLRKEEKEEQEGEEHHGASSILHKFSILAEGILAIWEGEDSVRRRIEGLGERQKAMKEKIKGAEAVQRELRERLRVLEQHGHEEQASLQQLKQERLHMLVQGVSASSSLRNHPLHSMPVCGTNPCTASSILQQQSLITSDAYCLASATTASVFSSRQCVAFEMLEFAHKRLTSHMWAHMCDKVRGMQGQEARGDYLQVFRGVEGRSVFGAKPLSEGTYAELLAFIEKEGPREEVSEAMAAAEGRLVEEACREGYARKDIGDIRKQMAVYLQCHRHFGLRRHSLRGSPKDNDLLNTGELDIIAETQRAANLGKLGALQPASKLIQLGCFFLCKSSNV